jgi:hypothetical protein
MVTTIIIITIITAQGPAGIHSWQRVNLRSRARIAAAAARLSTPQRSRVCVAEPRASLTRPKTGSEAAAFVIDFRGRDVVDHAEKFVRDRHWRAGLVAIDEENESAGIAVNLGQRRLIAIG